MRQDAAALAKGAPVTPGVGPSPSSARTANSGRAVINLFITARRGNAASPFVVDPPDRSSAATPSAPLKISTGRFDRPPACRRQTPTCRRSLSEAAARRSRLSCSAAASRSWSAAARERRLAPSPSSSAPRGRWPERRSADDDRASAARWRCAREGRSRLRHGRSSYHSRSDRTTAAVSAQRRMSKEEPPSSPRPIGSTDPMTEPAKDAAPAYDHRFQPRTPRSSLAS